MTQELAAEICDVEEARLMHSLDQIEAGIAQMAVTSPMREVVTHRFTPGLYIREIFMPSGSLLTSKIHRTEHPYVISMGRASVWTESDGMQRLSAPHTGITKPGTRRLLYIHEDTIWTTFHVNVDNNQDLTAIETRIIEPHDNPLLPTIEQIRELMR